MKFIARHEGDEIPVEVERQGLGYRVKLGERWITADLVTANAYLRSLRLEDGSQFLLLHDREGTIHRISFGDRTVHVDLYDPLALRRHTRDDEAIGVSGPVKAAMPGRIVRILVQPGDEVQTGVGLLVIEAMKMENEITAPRAGKVTAILVNAGETVESGAELVILD